MIARAFLGLGLIAFLGCKHQQEPVPQTATAPAPTTEAAPPAPPEPAKEAITLRPTPPILPNPAFLPDLPSPAENPTTPERVELGKMLFFDPHMSKSGQMSCEGCHYADKAWTVDKALSAKDNGGMNKRNAPTMLNIGFHQVFYWDGRKATLEETCAAAWANQLAADPPTVADTLNKSPVYQALFQRAFKEDANPANIAKALAAFLRTVRSGNSPWDKFEGGDKKAVSKQAQRGFEVFRKSNCALCHVPPLYTDMMFHNAGIGFDKPEAERDNGRTDATKDPKDAGKFKTPTLRDVANSAPYFHDGSAATLDDALDTMLAGGKKNANLDEKLKPVKLNAKDRAALKAFLLALNGQHTFAPVEYLPPIP